MCVFIYKEYMSINFLKLIPVLIKDDLQSQPSFGIDIYAKNEERFASL